ncbi:FadR/GntR family transcriptional regulator [Streptosporangium sp. DT93]|uniref:FadR/GntR family transcriptional regulator n=1 Tax=Streptosporangium sp. DT93 TaxID=3393428 RepID=UPI003CF447BF
MSLTDEAISRIRALVRSGDLPPGARLPPEHQLAAQLGVSRNPLREAVKALVVARVLDVRRGDGTYVTSLEPRLLLEGLGLAVELLRDDTLLEIVQVRRMLEPAATALAASLISAGQLAEVGEHLAAMRAARDDVEKLNHHDAAFHHAVVRAAGNETLSTLLEGISGRTLRMRVWRGTVEDGSSHTTIAQHEAIYNALAAGDAALAQAAALVHIGTTETWLRSVLENVEAPAAGAGGDRAPAGTGIAGGLWPEPAEEETR